MKNSLNLRNKLKKLDMFGIQPSFTYENDDTYKTYIGLLFSTLLYTFCICGIFSFSEEIFNKKRPYMLYSQMFQETPDRFNLSSSNFGFFLGVKDANDDYFIDSSIVDLEIVFHSKSLEEGKMILETEECDINEHFSQFKYQFNTSLSNLYCIKTKYYDMLSLAGSKHQQNYSYIETNLRRCLNSTSTTTSTKCKSQHRIDTKLNGATFVFNFIDTLLQPTDFENPSRYIRRDYSTYISNKYFKSWVFYFKNVFYNTDSGTLFEWISTEKFMQLDKVIEKHDFREVKDGLLLKSMIGLSEVTDIFDRRYIKIQDVMAQGTGLFITTKFAITILYNLYAKKMYLFNITIKLFEIEQDDEKIAISMGKDPGMVSPSLRNFNNYVGNNKSRDPHGISDNKDSQFNASKIENLNYVREIPRWDKKNIDLRKAEIIPLGVKIERKLTKKFNRTEGISFWDQNRYIFFTICMTKNDYEKRNKTFKLSQHIYESFNILNLLKCYNEITILKDSIFNNDQKQIFDYISCKGYDEIRLFNQERIEEKIPKIKDAFENLKWVTDHTSITLRSKLKENLKI